MSRLILVNRYFHPDESATSQFATDLARHLARGREVIVLASRQRLEDAGASLPRSAALGGVRIHRLWSTALGRGHLPGRALDYLTFLAAVMLWLLRHARRGDVVLAKTDPPLLGVATTLATPGRGVRRVQWVQDLFPEVAERLGAIGAGWPLARLGRALRNWSLRRSALVVAVSPGMADYLRPRCGGAPLACIENWAEDHALPGAESPPPGAGAANRPLRVGYCGNLGRVHPIGGLLQLAELATDGAALEFHVSGGGAHHGLLREHIERLGRANWTFLPYQPRAALGALLRRPDLHLVVLDPRVERFVFPSKLLGILSAGRPVLHLGDPGGEVALLLREEGCGWSLPAHDGAACLDLLLRLRAEPALLAQAGRAARQAWQRRYSAQQALARWDEALGRV
jgi:colanic acid biosynthesis glycosyl transferase WcaI